MRYVVHAFEQSFGSLHGIGIYFFVKTDDISEVEDIAAEASREIMSSYECIEDSLREKACLYCGADEFDEMDEDMEMAYEDAIEENIAYSIYEISSDCEYTNREIDKWLADSPESFIEEFCNLQISC